MFHLSSHNVYMESKIDERNTTNPLFDRRMKKVLNETNMICMDELREIAVIKHHLGALDHQKRLFLMYQSSGRGTYIGRR